ncbi:hypothetical protein U91I_00199 [alpha proteobacterium U9-1i]|nr:hypothetical protein U91I_00199 [alpha proteobacterium U9-1i]
MVRLPIPRHLFLPVRLPPDAPALQAAPGRIFFDTGVNRRHDTGDNARP